MKRGTTAPDLALYRRFLAEIGVDTLTLRELFAEEIERLPAADLLAPQRAVLTRVLARAAVKAKHRTAAR